jgi:mRNA-degrading endonuclease toxin of MazEF toxin-antitoxin module
MPRRGELYDGTFSDRQQVVIVVSEDVRNASWSTVLVAPVVTDPRLAQGFPIETAVKLGDAEQVEGTVLCDLVFTAKVAEFTTTGQLLGVVSKTALEAINRALVKVFDIKGF